MVTKDYLDEKMADLRGDLIGIDRKADEKTDKLVEILYDGRVLTAAQRKSVAGRGPFYKS